MEFAIRTHNISKAYPLYQRPMDRFKEALHPLRKKYHTDFYALRDINLEIGKSECIGLVGMNGSGKSTLLQIIAGVVNPTQGHCEVNGRISALLELGAGFNPEATGLANVKFQCALSGIDADADPSILESIFRFADIGQFVYQPVKTYSSGMFVRLAFACAISVDPDILIVDEALAVGDSYFQNKCLERMRQFRAQGKTLIFVSHDAALVKNICDRAYLLHKGQLVSSGDPDLVFLDYNEILASRSDVFRPKTRIAEARSTPQSHIKILASRLKNQQGVIADTFVSGDKATVEIDFIPEIELPRPNLGLSIYDRLGVEIFSMFPSSGHWSAGTLAAGQRQRLVIEFGMELGQDNFSLVIKEFGEDPLQEPIAHSSASFIFRVILSPSYRFVGNCRMDATVSFEHIEDSLL